jgi:putative ABC transport system permease protein
MLSVALKGLAGRKLRSALTAFAIVLGVAMVSGTFVLTDTIQRGFDTIFTQSLRNTDAVVTGHKAFGSTGGQPVLAPSVPASVLAKVRAAPGVEQAAPSVSDQAQLIDHKGKAIVNGGAPNLALGIDSRLARFNPLTLVEGRWPHGPDEVLIDTGTARKHDFKVGQAIGVTALGPVQLFRISGLARFTGVSFGGATLAIFDIPTAQTLFHKQGRYDQIDVAAKPGTPADKLVSELRAALPPGVQVRTAGEQVKADSSDTNTFITIFRYILLVFGGVALFVGSFVIANTLSITIAQRTREFATLRTLGASRRQVLGSVVVEALVIGALASIVGLLAGFGLARLLDSLLVAFGIDLPKAGFVYATRTFVAALIVGIVVSLLASLRPALRATRVPPISAVREGAELPPGRLSWLKPYVSLAAAALGIAILALGLFKSGLGTSQVLILLGVGVLLLFVGVAGFSSRLVRPLARVLGWPAERFGGAPGRLARSNTERNPVRTASTAAALMIGVALVVFLAVLAAGMRTTFRSAVNDVFHADYAITAQNNFSTIYPSVGRAAARVPGVTIASSIRGDLGRAYGSTVQVSAVEPNVGRLMTQRWTAGSQSALAHLGGNGAIVSHSFANKHHLTVGSHFTLLTTSGREIDLVVRAIFRPQRDTPATLIGDVTIPTSTFDRTFIQPKNLYTLLDTQGGATAANAKRLEHALKAFPNAKLQTKKQFVDNQLSGINRLLGLLVVLLLLSIVVSIIGIVNTLVLTVYERTRELGMLRAVGMTRSQVRRMIRYESVVTALMGAALGIVLGLGLAALVSSRISFLTYTIPTGQIILFVAAAILVGILAAILPARRAARLNVLEALQYE